MTESQLRARLAERLHRSDIPEELWQYLVEHEYVQDALLTEDEEGFEALVRGAKAQLQLTRALAKRRSPPGRTPRHVPAPQLDLLERARARAFSLSLGCHVATFPRIRRLRARLLGGVTLTVGQAEAFLRSPALRFLSLTQCQTLGMPLIGHEAHLAWQDDDVTLGGRIPEVGLRIIWSGGAYEGMFYRPVSYEVEIFLPTPDGLLEVWPGSVLGELLACSTWLTEHYPWEEGDALQFLLTGKVPDVSPVRLEVQAMEQSDLRHYRITLSVEPWVSATTVLRAYRAAQSMVLAGRDNRPVRERSLALGQFIVEQRLVQGKRRPWKLLMEAWNRRYPQWAYERVPLFARDAGRAEFQLRFPPYQYPRQQLAPSPGIAWGGVRLGPPHFSNEFDE